MLLYRFLSDLSENTSPPALRCNNIYIFFNLQLHGILVSFQSLIYFFWYLHVNFKEIIFACPVGHIKKTYRCPWVFLHASGISAIGFFKLEFTSNLQYYVVNPLNKGQVTFILGVISFLVSLLSPDIIKTLQLTKTAVLRGGFLRQGFFWLTINILCLIRINLTKYGCRML